MKRKLLICSSLITLLLSVFSVPIFAEETVQDSSTLHSLDDGVFLDSYFYENYESLPYLQSTGQEYIDTGIKLSSDISYNIKFSFDTFYPSYIFGYYNNSSDRYSVALATNVNGDRFQISVNSQAGFINIDAIPYHVYDVYSDGTDIYVDGIYRGSINNSFTSSLNSFVFARNNPNSLASKAYIKLYSLKIYDNVNEEYIRYYYPAKSKASGTIGLYDAVNKTFVSSASSVQFLNPTNEYVENFQISSFLTSSLTWIGQIFDAVIDMPIVIVFIAIGLAGAMFRWGRRIVHF